ncbi:hypothetical protein [Zymomonas mobilis]|uniref:hypothetical protein n=1 Tax=Zymomonas mobilis TaxID=542 RepID=UPI0039ED3222
MPEEHFLSLIRAIFLKGYRQGILKTVFLITEIKNKNGHLSGFFSKRIKSTQDNYLKPKPRKAI